jgi:hypothetical protein
LCEAFAAVGTSQPVKLTREQEGQLLVEGIDPWVGGLVGGYDVLPEELRELCTILVADVEV